ncbi:MAG: DUF1667 domain-containing protein [Cellulosilyticaceae bacterium]
MERDLICIVCPKGCRLHVSGEGENLSVTGNSCPRGAEYGIKEVTAPVRTVTSIVQFEGEAHHTLPVKTDQPIPKEKIMECMAAINRVSARPPIHVGDVLIEDLFGLGIQVVATRDQEV